MSKGAQDSSRRISSGVSRKFCLDWHNSVDGPKMWPVQLTKRTTLNWRDYRGLSVPLLTLVKPSPRTLRTHITPLQHVLYTSHISMRLLPFAPAVPSPTEMSPDWQIGNYDQGSKSCGQGEIAEGEGAESSKRLTAGVRWGFEVSRSCMNESA
jgi:hypothetical protein